ncbi:MAG TPA: HAMP domain-containing sensor histidine kinase [Coleofasciculaceae cyanobacterium]
MKKLSPRACLVAALVIIPAAAIARLLLARLTPTAWPYLFTAIVVVEQILIWKLFAQKQRAEDRQRQTSDKLQFAVAEGQQLLVERANLESRTRSLEERDRFLSEAVSGATHALKNPLTNINIVISRLSHESLSEGGQERLELARSQVAVMSGLIDNLLDYFRLDSNFIEPKLEQINLEYWLPEVIRDLIPRAISRRQTINCSVEKCEPLLSDKAMLGRAIAELLTNACKYSPSRSDIEVFARLDPGLDKHVIEIKNTGKIAFLEQAKIWDSFYRPPHGDPYKQGGHGFGLSLVKKIASKLDAKVSVSSLNNKVTFRVVL